MRPILLGFLSAVAMLALSPGRVPADVSEVPADPIVADPIVEIASDAQVTCARSQVGKVWCWGGPQGAPAETPPLPVGLTGAATVPGLQDAADLAVSGDRACAARLNGQVVCWRLTVGKQGVSGLSRPRGVAGLGDVVALGGGGGRFCAAARSGSLSCWRSGEGASAVGRLDGVVHLAVGPKHACALGSGGRVTCWGEPGPQLGGRAAGGDPLVEVAELEAAGLGVRNRASCAVRRAGGLVCWGMDAGLVVRGRAPREKPGFEGARSACLGEAHLCAAGDGGRVACWGDNRFGQLGGGKPGPRAEKRRSSWDPDWVPNPVPPVQVSGLEGVMQLACGTNHACALDATGAVWCWGANASGQLGDGTRADRIRPVRVVGLPGGPAPVRKGMLDERPLKLILSGPKAPWLDEREVTPKPWYLREGRRPRFGSYRNRRDTRYHPFWRGLAFEAVGVDAAIYRAGERYLAVHAGHGVIDPIAMPEKPAWIGLDGQDGIWVAGEGGVLWRAPDVLAARKDTGYVQVGTFPEAKACEVTKGLVVVREATRLHVSLDRGKTFRKVVPEEGMRIKRAFVRYDGVLLVQGELPGEGPLTLISVDGGETFLPSAFEAGELFHKGTWIYSNRCPAAVLSRDPEKWAPRDSYYDKPPGFGAWRGPLEGSRYVRPFDLGAAPNNLVRPLPPQAPAPGQDVTGADGACRGGGAGVLGGMRGRSDPAPGCGIACLRGTTGGQVPDAASRFWFLQDALCEANAGTCKPGTLTRRPHVAVVDGSQTRLAEPVCAEPIEMLSGPGLGLMACRTPDGTSIYSLSRKLQFSQEAEFGVPATSFQTVLGAVDGTLVMLPKCPKQEDCPPAWVRLPKAQGADLWRPTRVPGALTYRALARGQALVITRGSAPGHISLWIDRPGREPSAVAEDVRVDGDATKLRVAADGRVILELAMTTRGRQDHYLTRSGHLLPVEGTDP